MLIYKDKDMSDIKNFIEENNISFAIGERNASVTTLIGYAQHLKLTESEFRGELKQEIKDDRFIGEEITRLWSYCNKKNYKKFWKTQTAKTQYTF